MVTYVGMFCMNIGVPMQPTYIIHTKCGLLRKSNPVSITQKGGSSSIGNPSKGKVWASPSWAYLKKGKYLALFTSAGSTQMMPAKWREAKR